MSEIVRTTVPISVTPVTIEQQMAIGNNFSGEAPSLAGEPFVPYFSNVDGIYRMKQHDTPANDEGDKGGLFEPTCVEPFFLEQLHADFGESNAWTLSVVTSSITYLVSSGTGQTIVQIPHDRIILHPGEKIKLITTGAVLTVKRARLTLRLAREP